MKSAILNKIKARQKPNTLFVMSDYAPNYMVDPTTKTEILHLIKAGEIERFSYGLYYIPGASNPPNALDAIEIRYIQRLGKVYGFYTGECFLRAISGAPQNLDGPIELASNHATSGKKSVYAFSKRFTLRKPYVKVDKYNAALVSLLTFVSMSSLEAIKNNYPVLANYIRKEHLAAEKVMSLSASFPNKTAAKLIASDLYRSLWKH